MTKQLPFRAWYPFAGHTYFNKHEAEKALGLMTFQWTPGTKGLTFVPTTWTNLKVHSLTF